jgi:hypothetical protein
MSLSQECPDPEAFSRRDQIAHLWQAALTRLKLQAERAASAQSDIVNVKLRPVQVVWISR